jgi:ActR/RegA family two-component response regulator
MDKDSEARTMEASVLLLEKDLIVARQIEGILRHIGLSDISLGGSCQYALTWLASRTPTIAIVDPHLKDGRCGEVFEILRKRGVGFIVFGDDHVTAVERNNAVGGRWVAKPANVDVLTVAVRKELSKSVEL